MSECLGLTPLQHQTEHDDNDLNGLWQKFKDTFLKLTEKHTPLKVRRLKSRCNPWVTHEIIRQMYTRDHLKKCALKRNDHNLWCEYTEVKNDSAMVFGT